jgi:MFS transporter, DHA1 family, multidrug resistance protein
LGKLSGHTQTTGFDEKPSLSVLIAVSTVTPLAMQIYLPSLAGMMVVFSAGAGEIQLSMSAFFIAVAISQLLWGPLSDQFGRRPVIIAGMALFVLGSILCLLAPTIETLIAARAIQGAGGCAGLVLARAIVRDLHGPNQAASMIGYVSMGMAVMPTIAPAIGGLLDQFYGWQGGFFLMLLFGLGALWASIYALPETHKTRTSVGPGQVLRSYAVLFKEPLYWSYTLTATFLSFTYFAYLGGVPFIGAELMSLSAAEMGFYFMFVAIGYMVGNYISGKFAVRIGIYRMIFSGTLIGACGVTMIAGSAYFSDLTPYGFFLPMFILGLGNGVCLPSAVSGAVSVRPELTGAASGLTTSLQVGTGAVAGSLVAWLFADGIHAGTPWAMISVMAASSCLSMLAVLSVKLISERQGLVAAE